MFSYKPLWKMLVDKELNKSTFADNCNITRVTLSKLSKDQYVDMKSLDKICNYLQCNIEDIIQHIPD